MSFLGQKCTIPAQNYPLPCNRGPVIPSFGHTYPTYQQPCPTYPLATYHLPNLLLPHAHPCQLPMPLSPVAVHPPSVPLIHHTDPLPFSLHPLPTPFPSQTSAPPPCWPEPHDWWQTSMFSTWKKFWVQKGLCKSQNVSFESKTCFLGPKWPYQIQNTYDNHIWPHPPLAAPTPPTPTLYPLCHLPPVPPTPCPTYPYLMHT